MPVLFDAGSYVIAMYFEDHNPPHVHVVGPDFEGTRKYPGNSCYPWCNSGKIFAPGIGVDRGESGRPAFEMECVALAERYATWKIFLE